MSTTLRAPRITALLMFFLMGCADDPPAPSAPLGPCALLSARTPGPRQAEREAASGDARKIAEIFLAEARSTGDAGFHVLAESAAACALERDPEDQEAHLLHATALYHSHRFAEAEREVEALTVSRGSPLDWALLGDALMEQGRLDPAADAYQRAVDKAPEAALYDRIMYLRWLWGDMEGALEMGKLAAESAVGDESSRAWSLAWLGWLKALSGQPSPELDQALLLDPSLHLGRLFRARVRLAAGDRPGALSDLEATYTDFATLQVRRELDPTLDLAASCDMDPRGCAIALAETDTPRAKALINREYATRQDALTTMALAWIRARGGEDGAELARAALATGSIDPEVLYLGALVLKDPKLAKQALATGPGLLPSQRDRLVAMAL